MSYELDQDKTMFKTPMIDNKCKIIDLFNMFEIEPGFILDQIFKINGHVSE